MKPMSKELTEMLMRKIREAESRRLASLESEPVKSIQETESQTPEALQCPKCLSYDVRQCGYSKVRKDGTQSQRILCKVCKKTSTNGAKKQL